MSTLRSLLLNGHDFASMSDEETGPRAKKAKIVIPKAKVAPWTNCAEFSQVCDWLFGERANDGTHVQALDQFAVWQLRRPNRCPAAVQATKILLEVQLKDAAKHTPTDLQALFAFAIVRFYNFMSSTVQTHNMRTMYDCANELGMSSFVVDVRHLCAHSVVLPTLATLRTTADYCMKWIKNSYWLQLRDSMEDPTTTFNRHLTFTNLKLARLFFQYDCALECWLKDIDGLKEAKLELGPKRFTALKEFCKKHSIDSLGVALKHIVDELSSLIKQESKAKHIMEMVSEQLLSMDYFGTVTAPEDDAELQKIIKGSVGLVRMLAAHGFINQFFHSLVRIAECKYIDSIRRSSAGFWASQLVVGFRAYQLCKEEYFKLAQQHKNMKEHTDLHILNDSDLPLTLACVLANAGIDPKTSLIFGDTRACPARWTFELTYLEERMRHINAYTIPVIKGLIALMREQTCELNTEQLDVLETLTETFSVTGPGGSQELTNNSKVYTAIDVINLASETSHADDIECKNFGKWKLADDVNWLTVPLGCSPTDYVL